MNFKALEITNHDNHQTTAQIKIFGRGHLTSDGTLIAAEYSSLNYKDALAVTGKGAILKKSPLIAGIDVAGEVIESTSNLAKGTKVLVTGCGLGENHNGGLSQLVCVPNDWVVPLPEKLSTLTAMSYGTAGFTAALAVYRLLQNDQTPDKGPIVVTGASGGVGSIATALLAQLGFEVIAVSSKPQRHQSLKDLGAQDVLTIADLALTDKPLAKARFGGAIDNVGGEVLQGLIAHTNLWGNIACIGLALSPKLATTVYPMILRGVSLLGISSTNCPYPLRLKLWERLADTWQIAKLSNIVTKTIGLEEVPDVAEQMIAGSTYGRIIVDCQKELA